MKQPLKQYKSELAAMYLMAIAVEKGFNLNTTKVQKLLYMAYGYFLANFDGFILLDESPKAWPYGPVFPKTRTKVDYSLIYKTTDPIFSEISKDEVVTSVFSSIIERYSSVSASRLSEWSHSEGGAWDKTTKIIGFNWNMQIPTEYIRDYFSTIKIL